MHPSPLGWRTLAEELAWVETGTVSRTRRGGCRRMREVAKVPKSAPTSCLGSGHDVHSEDPEPTGSRPALVSRTLSDGEGRRGAGAQDQAGLRPAEGEAPQADAGRERADRWGAGCGATSRGQRGQRGWGPRPRRNRRASSRGAAGRAAPSPPAGPMGGRKRGRNHAISKEE